MNRYKWSIVAVLLLLTIAVLSLHSQDTTPGGYPGVTGSVLTRPHFVALSPDALGMNAVVLPASAATPRTNIIDLRGVRQLTLFTNCGQVFNGNITFYAEDGTTGAPVGNSAFSNAVAGAWTMYYLGSESSPGGSQLTTAGVYRLPQRAVSFTFTNTTVTPSTCTARMYLMY